MATVTNIEDALDGHVALEVECMDLLYLTHTSDPSARPPGGGLPHRSSRRSHPIAGVMEKSGSRFHREVRWVDEAVRARQRGVSGCRVIGYR